MLNIDLAKLGVTEEALKNAILDELGLTPEEAVSEIAAQLGVEVHSGSSAICNGDKVQTDQGETVAQVISDSDLAVLKQATAIQNRLFATS